MMSETRIKINKRFNYQANFGQANPLFRYPELYEAALDAFAGSDYEYASLNDILKRAKMPKSSFYYQFGDKLGLYLALMDVISQKKLTFFKQQAGIIQPEAEDFFIMMRRLSADTMDFMFLDKRMYHLSNHLLGADKGLLKIIMIYFPYDINAVLGDLIDKALAAGQLDSRYSRSFLVNLFTVLFTNIDHLLDGAAGKGAYATLNAVFDVLQNGVKQNG